MKHNHMIMQVMNESKLYYVSGCIIMKKGICVQLNIVIKRQIMLLKKHEYC